MDDFTKLTHIEMHNHFKAEQLKRNSWKFGLGLVFMASIAVIEIILKISLRTSVTHEDLPKRCILAFLWMILAAIIWRLGHRRFTRKMTDYLVFLTILFDAIWYSVVDSTKDTTDSSKFFVDCLRNFMYFIGLSNFIDALYLRIVLLIGMLACFIAPFVALSFSNQLGLLLNFVFGSVQVILSYIIFQSALKTNELSVFNDFAKSFDKNITWKKVIEHIPFSVAIIDLEGNVSYKNPSFDKLLKSQRNDEQLSETDYPEIQTQQKIYDTLSFISNLKLRRAFPKINERQNLLNDASRPRLTRSLSWQRKKTQNYDMMNGEPDLAGVVYNSFGEIITMLTQYAPSLMQLGFGWDSSNKEPRFEYVDAKAGNLSIEIALSYAIFNEKVSILLLLTDTAMRDEILRIEDRNQYKSLLLSSVSHELRTPVNGTSLLLAEAMEEPIIPEDIKQKYIKPVLLNVRRLVYMVEGISDYSQLSFGNRIHLENHKLNLLPFLDDLLEVIKFEAMKKKISLNLEVHKNIPDCLSADKKRLGQLLMNLLGNAVKFTEKGRISLILTTKNESITAEAIPSSREFLPTNQKIFFAVKDTGIGMNSEELRRLKKLLGRGLFEGKISKESTGACLGLKISNEIAKAMGSELYVRSEAHQGTLVAFFLQFPQDLKDHSNQKGLDFEHNFEHGDQEEEKASDHEEFTSRSKEAEKRNIEKLPMMFSDSGAKPSFQIPKEPTTKQKLLSLSLSQQPDSPTEHLIKLNLSLSGKGDDPSVVAREGANMLRSNNKLFLNLPPLVSSHRRVSYFDYSEEGSPTIFKRDAHSCCPDIFIVDDDLFNVDSVQRILQKKGYVTECAFNGKQAIDKLKFLHHKHSRQCSHNCRGVQLVLMDYNMPIMNGCDATRSLKELMNKGEVHKTQIIGCTAYSGSAEKARCLEAGMEDILIKPIKIEDVINLMKISKSSKDH